MSDEPNFAIDDGELEAAADLAADSSLASDKGSAPAAPPRVLIQYRNRGIRAALLPPVLILVVAIGITSYQRQAQLRPAPPPAPRAKPAARADAASSASSRGRIIMVEPAGTGAAVQPITIRSAAPPPPPTVPDFTSTAAATDAPAGTASSAPGAAAPGGPEAQDALAHAGSAADSGPFSPFSPEARKDDARAAAPPLEPPAPLTSTVGRSIPLDSPELAFAPAAVIASVTRDTPETVALAPKLTKEQIQKEIDDEAQRKKAEQANLGREVEQAKAREFFETIKKAADDRVPFHDELYRILLQLGNDAGPEIKNLCDRYGRTTHPRIETEVKKTLNRSGPGLNRDAKIRILRMQGLPEAMILDILANDLDKGIRGTRLARDRDGVRVQAARLLLRNKPPPPPPATP
jgi:hypothetical protein